MNKNWSSCDRISFLGDKVHKRRAMDRCLRTMKNPDQRAMSPLISRNKSSVPTFTWTEIEPEYNIWFCGHGLLLISKGTKR